MRKFSAEFGDKSIGDIKKSELQVWVRNLDLAPKTKKNLFRTLRLVFEHAIKHQLRTDNPAIEVELPTVAQATPGRFTVAECELLLLTAVRTKSRFLAALVIGLFIGARPAEICRLKWTDISMEEERINFPSAEGKTYKYHWVHISALLRLWLEFDGIKPTGGVIAKHDFETYERWRKKLVIDAGLTRWPHDVLRHTNASFSYSLHGDFDSLAASLGNSPAISRKHYIAPATRKEAEQFLQLTPEKIQAVLQLQNDSNPPASDTK